MPIFRLTDRIVFPPPHLASEEGLLAVGGDLRTERLLLAYRMGIFPWYTWDEPILWWCPDPRTILTAESLHVSKSLRRLLKKAPFQVSMDTAFADVIAGCANAGGPGRDETWITSEMLEAYIRLHAQGFAHSVECWQEGELAGGLYGVSLGRCFFGESMFSRVSNASKVALIALVHQVREWGFHFIDCQLPNRHLYSLGAFDITRQEFLRKLDKAVECPGRLGPWEFLLDINSLGR